MIRSISPAATREIASCVQVILDKCKNCIGNSITHNTVFRNAIICKSKLLLIDESVSTDQFNDSEIIEQLINTSSFGYVYYVRYNNKRVVVKISDILNVVNNILIDKSQYNYPENYLLDEFINECDQIIKYGSLISYFPNNIIKIFNTCTSFVENNIFPVNIIYMEHITGNIMSNYITNMPDDNANEVISLIRQLLAILLYCNLCGYYHNDVNLHNILVQKCNLTDVVINFNDVFQNSDISHNSFITIQNVSNIPVLVDYSFSKFIDKKILFPIECVMLLSVIKINTKCITLLSWMNKIDNILSQLLDKYNIYSTNFINKILSGNGIFDINDYNDLPSISNDDVLLIINNI
jgi:serine/threonine protein kinase